MLIFSTVTITLASIFYSIGVWSEQITSYLRGWHVPVFRIGVVFDISGTLGILSLIVL